MEDIYLTASEKRLLRKLRIVKQSTFKIDISVLLENKLITVANPRTAGKDKPFPASCNTRRCHSPNKCSVIRATAVSETTIVT